ncbi:MAG: hypothetical protein KAS23_13975 [Anaerohalosphaera sp.]|nr:hypothetical protein [Anaerohalosphaera sp.]
MRQPDKNRFLNAVNHIEADDVPFFEMEADIAIVCQIMDRQYDMSLHSFELPIDDVVEYNRRLGNDMVFLSHVWHLGRKEKTDTQGRVHYIDGTMKDINSLKNITFPDMDRIERRLEELLDAVDGTGFGVICGAQTAGFTVPTAIGYEDFCMKSILDPAFITEFQKRVHEYTMRELEMYMQYPIDAIKIASGLITNTGSMISPEMMEQFEYPYMREQMKLIKAHNKLVHMHVDGYVIPLIPLFLEMGIDILNPIDPCSGKQDICRIKELYGDQLTLCGNIDINTTLLEGTPQQVAEDVTDHINKLANNGGYIVASSHDLHQLIPIENICAMRDAAHAWKRQ